MRAPPLRSHQYPSTSSSRHGYSRAVRFGQLSCVHGQEVIRIMRKFIAVAVAAAAAVTVVLPSATATTATRHATVTSMRNCYPC